jgi:hypothetical protein
MKRQINGRLIDYLLFNVPLGNLILMETSPLPMKGCDSKAYVQSSETLSREIFIVSHLL